MSETESRRLYSNLLGFYVQTYFRIHIDTNMTFKYMSDKDYSVLAHEYIHFLQDISTTYGAFNAYAYSEFIKSVAEAIRQSPDGTIVVPYTPDIASDNVYANYCLRELTYGSTKEITRVEEVIEIKNIKESIDSSDLDSIPTVSIELRDGEERIRKIDFGACAVMESMAYLIEQFTAPKQIDAPDYPYKIAEIIVQKYYPDFGNDKMNIIALCDVSLLTSAPGHSFISLLVQFKRDGWLPIEPSDVYGKVLDEGYDVSGSKPGQTTFEEEMGEMCKLAIQSLQTYFNESMTRFRKWIEATLKRGFALRIKNRDFMLDIARGGNIKQNPVLKVLINDLIGTPIMTNPSAEGTIKSPNVRFDSDFYLFPAVGEVIKLFDKGQCNCEMKNICSHNGGDVDDRCDTAPWTHEVSFEHFCPYSLLWHNWAFRRCKPIGQRNIEELK